MQAWPLKCHEWQSSSSALDPIRKQGGDSSNRDRQRDCAVWFEERKSCRCRCRFCKLAPSMPPVHLVQTPVGPNPWVGAVATVVILLLPAAVPHIAKSTRHLVKPRKCPLCLGVGNNLCCHCKGRGKQGGVFTGTPLSRCSVCDGRGRQLCALCEASGFANHWLYQLPANRGKINHHLPAMAFPCSPCPSLRPAPQHLLVAAHAVAKRSPKRLKYSSPASRKNSQVQLLQLDPSGSDVWRLDPIVELIQSGAVCIIPTDTVYAIVCDLKNRQAIDRLYRIKNLDPMKPLSILCRSFQDIDKYTLGFPRGNSHGQTNVFRAARQCLPGPYTFILTASKEMPKQCTTFGGSAAMSCAPRKSVGVRMPDDAICAALLSRLDEPLLCTSVRQRSEDDWMLDPVIIADTYGASEGREGVDFVVDGGERLAYPSTVIDMTGVEPTLLRRGKGPVEDWMLMESHDSTESVGLEGMSNPYA